MEKDLLSELTRRGIRLRHTAGRLDVIAPPGTLTPELRAQLRDRRDDLVDILRAGEQHGSAGLEPAPAVRHEPFPLTEIQHAYWMGLNHAYELGGFTTHLYVELERDGLDTGRLEAALRKVIRRHDMLRAVIDPDGQQRILAEVPDYQLEVTDLTALDEPACDAARSRLRGQMAAQVLDPRRWPVFDIRASRLGARVRLHLSLSLLILDAYSIDLLFRDWKRFYLDPAASDGPLDLSFRDCVLHELAARDGAEYRAAERYWHDRLVDLPRAPELPLATAPGQLAEVVFTRRHASVPRAEWAALKGAARARGVTPSVVLMTAFADVLRLWTGQQRMTLNLTMFNRPPIHPRIGEVVGDFTTLLMLAVDGGGSETTFTERARRTQAQLMRDLQHSAYSGVAVLRERARLAGGGPGAGMPVVFTSALGLTGAGDVSPSMGFFGNYRYAISQTPQVWLDHQVAEEAGALVFNWDAVEALFPPGLLDDMLATYRRHLGGLAADETAWDQAAVLLPPETHLTEQDRANATTGPLSSATLDGLVEAQALRTPDATAVVCDGVAVSYADLVRRARRVAGAIRRLGVEPNTLVGVVVPKSIEQVVAALAVTMSGAAYLPIDAGWPVARRDTLLAQGKVRVALTGSALARTQLWPDGVVVVEVGEDMPEHLPDEPRDEPQQTGRPSHGPEDLAYVIFTSGSTGTPKGVMIDHRGAVNTLLDVNERFGVGEGDSVLALSSLSFDLSVYDVFGVLAAGGTVVLPTPGSAHDPHHWSDLTDKHGITVWNSVPALMQAWLDSGGSSPRLRVVLLSGDWIPVGLPDAVRARCPQARVISLGGATEASIWSVHFPVETVPREWSRIPYGKPLRNQTLHVYDEALRPCPTWATGEIYIGGAGVALGYWGDAERTAERFLVHPVTGERLYRTGDLGRYLPGGDIDFLGRRDHQVKLNGYRVELGEVTAALTRQGRVGEAVAAVATNPVTGRRQLVAYVVPGRPDRASAVPGPGQTPVWPRLIEAGTKELAVASRSLARDLGSFSAMWRAMEALCPAVMARTLAALGALTRPGETWTAAQVAETGGVVGARTWLVAQWLETLAAAGVLEPATEEGGYSSRCGLDVDRLDTEVRGLAMTVPVPEAYRPLWEYFLRCIDHQVDLLRGGTSPVELLLPGGSFETTEVLYETNPVSRLLNRVAAAVVRSTVDCRASRGRGRILEVGAGTGGTTGTVLERLTGGAASYTFTDVSRFFTDRAPSRFAAYPFVDYGVYDIDREPAPQGYAAGSYDVVLAANVMHDARDLDASLRGLHTLLAPGGVLVLVEGTVNTAIQAVTVAFIEGFSHHQGRDALPLLSAQEWTRRLRGAGFTRAVAVPETGAATDVMVQHVLIAEATPGREEEEQGAALDPGTLRRALDELLPDYMVPQHYVVLDALPLSGNGKVDVTALPSPWSPRPVPEVVAPRTPVEERLVAIWREVLGRDDIGTEENFFELGGDSLHAVQILGRLREELGFTEPADEGMRRLFESPTVSGLASVLDPSRDGGPS
jgi:amino acid adenylation domain-containing protein